LADVTDDELTDLVITAATSRYRYGADELSYVVAGTITEQLGIDEQDIECDLIDEWLRQFRLAVRTTTGMPSEYPQRPRPACSAAPGIPISAGIRNGVHTR
jgi:hypothetical protein